jgi:hypothetical protein
MAILNKPNIRIWAWLELSFLTSLSIKKSVVFLLVQVLWTIYGGQISVKSCLCRSVSRLVHSTSLNFKVDRHKIAPQCLLKKDGLIWFVLILDFRSFLVVNFFWVGIVACLRLMHKSLSRANTLLVCRYNILSREQRRQFFARVSFDTLSTPMALIHLCVTDSLTQFAEHGALALFELRVGICIPVILIDRVKLIELVCKAYAPKRFWFILSRIVNDSNIPNWRSKLSLEITHCGFHISVGAALYEVLVNVLNALQLVLLVTSWPKAIATIFLAVQSVTCIPCSVCISIKKME